jgi:hypothetical protein
MKNGTPDHRQLVPVVLAPHVVTGLDGRDGPEHLHPLVAQTVGVSHGGRLRGEQAEDLEEVVLHDVAQGAHRVVEAAAVVHPEVLGHGDVDAADAVARPQRLEDGVGEAEEQDVHRRLLAQEMVDPQDLPFLEALAQFGVEGPGRRQVVAEGFLHHHPGVGGQAGAGQTFHHHPEQRRGDLEVEHRALPPLDGLGHPLVGLGVGVVPRHHAEPGGQSLEHRLVDHLLGVLHRPPGVLAQGGRRPLVKGHPDDGAGEQVAPLEPVEGAEGHLLGQVPGDPEDHQDVSLRRRSARGHDPTPPRGRRGAHLVSYGAASSGPVGRRWRHPPIPRAKGLAAGDPRR